MSDGTAENVGTEPSFIVDTGMQLETIMFTLPVMASMGVASGNTMVLSSDQPTDFEHCRSSASVVRRLLSNVLRRGTLR